MLLEQNREPKPCELAKDKNRNKKDMWNIFVNLFYYSTYKLGYLVLTEQPVNRTSIRNN